MERKLKQTQQQKKARDEAAYLDPAKAAEAKERGNELFKARAAAPARAERRRGGTGWGREATA